MAAQTPRIGNPGSSVGKLGCRRLEAAEDAVSRWGSRGAAVDGSYGVPDSAGLASAVKDLISIGSHGGAYGQRAEVALQAAMRHLEDDFRQVLISGTYYHSPGNLEASLHDGVALPVRSFSFSSLTNLEAVSISSFSTSPSDDSRTHCTGYSRNSLSMEKVHLYLIDPEASVLVKEIAELMILAGHAQNLSHAYGETRNSTLMQCLCLLGVQIGPKNFNPAADPAETLMQLDGKKMKMWIQALRVIVGIVLPEEREACTKIFRCDSKVEEDCFARATTRCTQQLIAIGMAIANVKDQRYEKLPLLLQMHEELVKLQLSIDGFWSGDAKDLICQDTNLLLDKVREETLLLLYKFLDAQINHESYEKIMLDGSILSWTQYTMDIIKLLTGYSGTLNLILPIEEGNASMRPWEHYVVALLSRLQLKIEDKSKFYKDGRLQNIFLMNNAMHVLEKARSPDLAILLGEGWISEQLIQVERYATAYLRASWAGALFCLTDSSLILSGYTGKVSYNRVKEIVKKFNSAFGEISRVQTTWKVPNPQLRQQLRIVILQLVFLAYRAFVRRFGRDTNEVKYAPDDIESHVLDLFEG